VGSGNNPVTSGYSTISGPYLGLAAEYKITHLFSLQVELNYSAQGGKKNGNQAIATGALSNLFPPNAPVPPYVYANFNSKAHLNYLELPVLARFNFRLDKKLSFQVNAGPYAGYLLSAKNITSGSSQIYADAAQTQPLTPTAMSFNNNQDIKDQVHKFNCGIQGGVGLTLQMHKSYWYLNGGGNYGFLKIQKDASNGQSNTGCATVVLGYFQAL
jgi:hypothetical protein